MKMNRTCSWVTNTTGLRTLVAAVAMMGAMSASAATELVTNGGFEEGCNPSATGWKYRYNENAVVSGAAAEGWTLLDASGISHASDETWVHAGYEGKGEVVCFCRQETQVRRPFSSRSMFRMRGGTR